MSLRWRRLGRFDSDSTGREMMVGRCRLVGANQWDNQLSLGHTAQPLSKVINYQDKEADRRITRGLLQVCLSVSYLFALLALALGVLRCVRCVRGKAEPQQKRMAMSRFSVVRMSSSRRGCEDDVFRSVCFSLLAKNQGRQWAFKERWPLSRVWSV